MSDNPVGKRSKTPKIGRSYILCMGRRDILVPVLTSCKKTELYIKIYIPRQHFDMKKYEISHISRVE